MNARITRSATLALMTLVFIATALPAAAATYYFNFTTSFSPWIKGNDSGAAASSLTVVGPDNACPVGTPGGHARLTAGPGYTSFSGLWMFARFPATSSNEQVKVTWQARDDFHCPTCYPIVYVGTSIPSSSAPFTTLSPMLGTSWTGYSYTTSLSGVSGAVVVAVGWKGAPSSLPAAVGIDCLLVDITP
jgi:hypothetical protein